MQTNLFSLAQNRVGRQGNILVGVLVAGVVLSILSMAVMKQFRVGSRAINTLQKGVEIASLETSIQTILNNGQSCVKSLSSLDLNLRTPQNLTLSDAFGVPYLQAGGISQGVAVQNITAWVSEPDRNVQQVRIQLRTSTGGNVYLPRDYEFTHYVNIAVNGANIIRCFRTENPQAWTLLKSERVKLPANLTSVPDTALIVNDPGPYPWGSNAHNVVVVPTLNCTGANPPNPNEGTCSLYDGPVVSIKAEGNRLEWNFAESIGRIALSTPAGGSKEFTFGVKTFVRVSKGGVLVKQGQLARMVFGTLETGFQSIRSFNSGFVDTVPGETYDFQLRGVLGGNDNNPSAHFAGAFARAKGEIKHYMTGTSFVDETSDEEELNE